ncbi:23S rRNA (guanosine(2251)-2'-O)-methyltransferase RlmB [Endozoicomonas gorgoniicola]|uniref:23S rRNA (guanosine-2'-O-)-methyltransferase RlmB n=1 Tax=Endozoicomonas gorgoniicola TaxID=1234144 RepID=A0ABT3N0G5_9GAMM|nr:23S rRNA (guanosine(2251)-2'-O)-methyltransferase RlmB [Endozoicomonas gorgoniicola]MCW7555121.1 23S rRNA (guanosine(2251)-2'-O)-methyltransferase RlmB [Endozoicomonas gorgoniicola]
MNDDVVFGLHAVQSLFEHSPEKVLELMIQKGRTDKRINQLVEDARRQGVTVRFVERNRLDGRVDGGVHQGIVARVAQAKVYREGDLEDLLDNLEEPPFLLILDGVTDPHNLGACLRTADAAGVHAMITPRDKSASLNATARKVACGAADNVPLVQVTNLARTMEWLKERGVWMIGTAGESAGNVYEADLKGPMALVMGAEGKGMRRLTRDKCDSLVFIPMAGTVSSLNVSVATGVCLFEAVRQRS